MLEKRFIKPVLKTQSEVKYLDVDIGSLKNKVIICTKYKYQLVNVKSKIHKIFVITIMESFASTEHGAADD